jgi:hypothetical protein
MVQVQVLLVQYVADQRAQATWAAIVTSLSDFVGICVEDVHVLDKRAQPEPLLLLELANNYTVLLYEVMKQSIHLQSIFNTILQATRDPS